MGYLLVTALITHLFLRVSSTGMLSYTQVSTMRFTISPMNEVANEKTMTGCASRCYRSSAAGCSCFMYNTLTERCQLGFWLVNSAPSVPSTNDKVYTSNTSCSQTGDFNIVSYGAVSVCLWLSTTALNFAKSSTACKGRGGQLYTIKTIEKFKILLKAVDGRSEMYWIGLTDIQTENRFVWEDDGTVITTAMRKAMFAPGQPNGGTSQNCVRYDYEWFPFSDYFCSSAYKFACEIP